MAYACDICQKRHQSGHNVSHANNRTKRVFKPNLQTVRALINGAAKRIRVCTRCVRSGAEKKAVYRPRSYRPRATDDCSPYPRIPASAVPKVYRAGRDQLFLARGPLFPDPT